MKRMFRFFGALIALTMAAANIAAADNIAPRQAQEIQLAKMMLTGAGKQQPAGGGDTTPNAFSFTNQTGVAISTVITSNTITPAGYDTPTGISISGSTCEYQINAGSFTSAGGTLSPTDTVTIHVTSSGSNSTAVTCDVTIGGVAGTQWSVTTVAGGALITLVASPVDVDYAFGGGTNAGATAQAFGTAHADRQLILTIVLYSTGSAPSAITIGGVAATQVVARAITNSIWSGVYIANVTTGTSGDIVVTVGNNAIAQRSMALWRMVKASPTASDTCTGFGSFADAPCTTATALTIPASGIGVWGCMCAAGINGTNVTMDYNGTFGAHGSSATTGDVTGNANSGGGSERTTISGASWAPCRRRDRNPRPVRRIVRRRGMSIAA